MANGPGDSEEGMMVSLQGYCLAQMEDKGIWLEGPTWQLEQRSEKGDTVKVNLSPDS